MDTNNKHPPETNMVIFEEDYNSDKIIGRYLQKKISRTHGQKSLYMSSKVRIKEMKCYWVLRKNAGVLLVKYNSHWGEDFYICII